MSANGVPVLDLGHLAEIRSMPGIKGGSLLNEFVALFMREEPARIAELSRLAQAQNYEELKRMAHATAGSCAMLGALAMQHAALAVQAGAKAKSTEKIAASLAELDAAWVKVQAALVENKIL